MVLDNASTSNSSDAVAYYAPADDTDQYADPQEPGDLYKIDTTGFPKPIPVLGRLLGYDDQLFAKNLHEKIRHRNSVLGRHPTQEEANALGCGRLTILETHFDLLSINQTLRDSSRMCFLQDWGGGEVTTQDYAGMPRGLRRMF
jgi:hypothetical protein